MKTELRHEIVGALSGAQFPIQGPDQLLAAFPDGGETTCQAEGVKLRAGDAGGVRRADDFPFRSAEPVAETILSRAL